MELPEGGGIQLPPGSTYEFVTHNDKPMLRVCYPVFKPNAGPITPPVCTDYPAVPFIQAVPAYSEFINDFAWTAGANSIDELDDDVKVSLTMGGVAGVVMGFVPTARRDDDVSDYSRMTHALYFHLNGGRPVVRVMENGGAVGGRISYNTGDTFEIRRYKGVVSYWRSGTQFYTSLRDSSGALFVGTSMYGSGDEI